MECRILNLIDKERFNSFIESFPTGDLLQSWEWGDLKAKSGWKPVRIIGEEHGKIVAAASILCRRIPKTNKNIMYVSRGPVLDLSDKQRTSLFLNHLKTYAKNNGAILLKIDPPVEIEDTISTLNLIENGFKLLSSAGFGGTQPKCVMQLDLVKPIEDISADFKPKWRYNIRLAEKKGVSVNLNCKKEELSIFYKLLEETCKRDQFLVRGYKYFEDMWDLLIEPGYIKLVLTYFEGTPVAGALAFKFGDRAMYTYGASSNTHRNMMPNHLMQWKLIEWAKESGCKWYDFRGVSPKKDAESDSHLEGLNRFKEGFAPRFVEYIGEYDYVVSPIWYSLWVNLMPKVKAFMKRRSSQIQE